MRICRVCTGGAIALIISLLVAQSVAADSVRIMPLGDSDTQGYGGYVSYRYDLWFRLVEAGYDVDFVGRRTLTHSPINAALYPRYDDFDQNHEGRYSALLEHMASGATNLAEVNRPHIVLFLGSHDICEYGGGAGANVQRYLPSIIDNIRSVDPNVHFLIGQIYPYEAPSCDPNAPYIIPGFNQSIAEAAAAKDTPQSRVFVVDHYTGYNAGTMYDGGATHSNRQGEMFLANNWFGALEDLIPLIDTEGSAFVINAGLNDAWYNPATAGQGFFITVFPDIEMMFLAWFTYDTERPPAGAQASLGEPGHRWLTAFGPYAGDTADLEIEMTSGGVFDAAEPAPVSVSDGTVMIEFDGCNAATLTYDIDSAGVAGEIPIQRIAADNLAACEALTR